MLSRNPIPFSPPRSRAGKLFRRFIELLLLLYPLCWSLLLSSVGQAESPLAAHDGFVLLAVANGIFATFGGILAWQAYRVSGEVFLRLLAAALFVAAVADGLPLLEFIDPALNGRAALLFATLGRLEIVFGLFVAIHMFHKPAEKPRAFGSGSFWRATANWIIWSSLVLLAIVSAPMAVVKDVHIVMNVAAVLIALLALASGLRGYQDTPLLNALLASLVLFVQVALISVWSDGFSLPGSFSFVLSVSAYLVLGHGLVSRYALAGKVNGEFGLARTQGNSLRKANDEEDGPKTNSEASSIENNEELLDLCRRMDFELERGVLSATPVSLLGLAVERWDALEQLYGQESIAQLRLGIITKLKKGATPLDLVVSDGESFFFMLCPDTNAAQLKQKFDLLRSDFHEAPVRAGSLVLFIDCCGAVVTGGEDGKGAQDLLNVCRHRLDIALSSGDGWCGPSLVWPKE